MSKPAQPSTPDELIRSAGLRRTPVRVGVLRVLSAATAPLDAPAIVAQLPDVTDTVTVYRTLNTFTAKKIVHRIRGAERAWLYGLGRPDDARAAHRHPHFVCDDCGKVDCLNDARIPAGLVRSLGVADAYAVTYPEVTLHGRCPACR